MEYSPGLEGVIAGETAISNVEGAIGRLSYRGLPIEDIADMDYIAAVHLVLFDVLPDGDRRAALESYLADHGRLNAAERSIVASMPAAHHPMAILQSVIPVLDLAENPFDETGEMVCRGLQVIAKLPAVIATIAAQRNDRANPGLFDADDDYLCRYLAMMTGERPTERALDIFRVVQLLQLEHSFNAGTFAARVIGSTLADVTAVLSGAVGALSGVLHGGADQAALLAAREVGSPAGAGAFVDDLLARKGRLMGMGHREYRTVDPRSKILRPLAEELSRGTAFENDFNTLLAIEKVFNERMAERGKEVWANLEFYKGVVYEALGITPDYFTATFAMSRAVGWLSHLAESRRDNRIIRPAARYIGRPAGAPGSVTHGAKGTGIMHELA